MKIISLLVLKKTIMSTSILSDNENDKEVLSSEDDNIEEKQIIPIETSYSVYRRINKINPQQLLEGENLPYITPKSIGFSLFGLYNADFFKDTNMVKINKVAHPKKKDSNFENTIFDRRLGSVSANDKCKNDNCSLVGEYCNRHLGYIELAIMVYNPMYLKSIVRILNTICGNCGRLKINKEEIENEGLLDLPPNQRLKILEKLTKDILNCSGESVLVEGDIECYTFFSPIYSIPARDKASSSIIMKKRELVNGKIVERPGVTIDPESVFDLLDSIDDQNASDIFGFNIANGNHPRNMIMKYLIVPAPSNRTNDIINDHIKSDPFGEKYNSIIKENNVLMAHYKGITLIKTESILLTTKNNLISKINDLIANSSSTGYSKSYTTILNGKVGLVRANLNSGRVNQSGRAVASHNPLLKYYQVGVPASMAMGLSVPITLNPENIKENIELFRSGRVVSFKPGVNSIYRNHGGTKRVTEINRKTYQPAVGDILNRWVQDGDDVIVNRAPTLHHAGIVGMEAKILDGYTIKLLVEAVAPFNGDFDGDEFNIHVPQSDEAREEVATTMSIRSCIRGGQDNKLNIAIVYMAIENVTDMTTNYNDEPDEIDSESNKIFNKKSRYNPDEDYVNSIFDDIEMDHRSLTTFLKRLELVTSIPSLEEIIIEAGIELKEEITNAKKLVSTIIETNNLPEALRWYARAGRLTGKILFSLALPYNLEYKAKGIIIRHGILISGIVDKSHIGTSHYGISDVISINYSTEDYELFLENLIRILDVWNIREGFSIGYTDCLIKNPDTEEKIASALVKLKVDMLELEYKKTGNKRHDRKITKEMETRIEGMQSILISAAQDEPSNDPFIKSQRSGAKGSITNISRIKFGGMPYFIRGGMVKPTLRGPGGLRRTSCYQFHGNHDLIDWGVVTNSLTKGFTLREMIVNAQVSREGTLKGILKTGVTGTIFRDMRLYLQNIRTYPDGSVRDVNGDIIQSVYGYDALNPKKLSLKKEGNSIKQIFIFLKERVDSINAEFEKQ